MTTIKNVTEKKIKELTGLIGFLSANKVDNYNGVGGFQKNLQNKSEDKKDKCFS